MKLHEYQSKEVLSRYGVVVPAGDVTSDPSEALAIAEKLGGKVVVKAQVLMGGRGKAGGVKLFDSAPEAAAFTKDLIGKRLISIQNPDGMIVEKVLIAEQVDISEEYYLSVLMDRALSKLVVMMSTKGGMDIEEVAEEHPESIVKLEVNPAWGVEDFEIRRALNQAGFAPKVQGQLVKMIRGLVKAYLETEADLIEINPCALTPEGKIIAADAKVSLDENALFRHPEYLAGKAESAEDPIEAEAAEHGIAYVRLGGEVGVMGNGAGLVMCSMDEVRDAGGTPANFLDVGGGAQAERVKTCLSLILKDPNVKGILINIFGGITRCDEVAKGLLAAYDQMEINIPVVARIEGTAAEEGRKLLEGSRLIPAETMQEAALKIVSAIQNS